MNPKSKNLLIAATQFIILMALAVLIIYSGRNVRTLTIDPNACRSDYAACDNGVFTFDETIIDSADWVDALVTDNISLKSGSYTLYIDYECLADKQFALYDGTKTNAYLRNDTGWLRSENKCEMFKFRTVADLDSFQVKIKYQPFGYLKIKGISVVSNNVPFKTAFFLAFIIFFIFDLAYIKRDFVRKNKIAIANILAVTFIVSLPLFIPQIASGHDLEFALLRIEGICRGLKDGQFPVYLHDLSLKGCGYPLSIYYGDVFLYLPALLRLVGFNVTNAWKLYIAAVNLATVIIAYVCFKKMCDDRNTAGLMTLAYAAAPYRLADIYARAAAGEFTSITFYPLIAYALYKIYTSDKEDNDLKKYSTLLALGVSAVVCTHMLSTLMLAFVLVLTALILFKKTFCGHIFKCLLTAALKTVFISAAFLVPFLDYYTSVRAAINDTVSKDIKAMQYGGAYIADYFSLDHTIFVGERVPFSPGLVLMAALIACIILALSRKTDGLTRFLILMSLVFLFISSDLFPWDALTARFSLFRILSQVQLPSRYICFAIIFLTLTLWKCLENLRDTPLKKFLYILAGALILIQVSLFTGRYESEQSPVSYTNTSNIDTVSVGAGEYLLAGSDMYTDNYSLTGRTGDDITLPKYNYKGYHAYDDLGNELNIKNGPNNLISVTVPSSYQGSVNVRFITPFYWRIAWLVSLAALVFLTVIRPRLCRDKH